MSTALKVVAWVLGSVVLLVLLGVGALWWSLSGGWDGIRPAAQPDDRRVVQARDAGLEPLARLAGPVEQALADGGDPLGDAQVAGCEQGQNNWKVQDGYTLSCSQATVLAATAGSGPLDQAADAADAQVRALGWTPAEYGEMETLGSGSKAQGRYEHPDDPEAVLHLEVANPGSAGPYLTLSRISGDDEARAQPVLDAARSSAQVTVLAVVERTYFEDD